MASTGPLDFHTLDYTLGVVFMNVVVGAGVWGIITTQVYWYYTTYPKDRMALKLLVAVVWTFETAHQIVISYATVYYYVITNYFNPPALKELHPTAWIPVLLEIMCSFLVQSFFLKRIWHLSKRRLILLVLPAVLIVGRLVVGLVWVALAAPQTKFADLNSQGHTLSECVHGLATGGDILLASLMVYFLHKSRTGLRRTDNMINKLMLYAVNTGAVTALAAIAILIPLLAFPTAFLFSFSYNCIGGLYISCMLASLNARKNLRNQTMDTSLTSDLGGHSQSWSRQSRVDVSNQSIPGSAFEGSNKIGSALENSGKMGMYINTTRSPVKTRCTSAR